jgi:hypothetical protein
VCGEGGGGGRGGGGRVCRGRGAGRSSRPRAAGRPRRRAHLPAGRDGPDGDNEPGLGVAVVQVRAAARRVGGGAPGGSERRTRPQRRACQRAGAGAPGRRRGRSGHRGAHLLHLHLNVRLLGDRPVAGLRARRGRSRGCARCCSRRARPAAGTAAGAHAAAASSWRQEERAAAPEPPQLREHRWEGQRDRDPGAFCAPEGPADGAVDGRDTMGCVHWRPEHPGPTPRPAPPRRLPRGRGTHAPATAGPGRRRQRPCSDLVARVRTLVVAPAAAPRRRRRAGQTRSTASSQGVIYRQASAGYKGQRRRLGGPRRRAAGAAFAPAPPLLKGMRAVSAERGVGVARPCAGPRRGQPSRAAQQ